MPGGPPPFLAEVTKGTAITAQDENAKRRALRDLLMARRPWGRTGGSSGVSPGLEPYRLTWFVADSAASTGIVDCNGNPVQWVYQTREVYPANRGYRTAGVAKWKAIAGGYSGNLYNVAEDGNDGTGRQMNGTDHDGTLYSGSSFAMRPIPTDRVLMGCIIWAADEDGDYGSQLVQEAWVDWNNREDGEC